jgi:hypothetical protein
MANFKVCREPDGLWRVSGPDGVQWFPTNAEAETNKTIRNLKHLNPKQNLIPDDYWSDE